MADLSEKIVEAVLRTLSHYGGFDHWWDDIYDEDKALIIEDLEAEVDSFLQEYE